MTEDNKKINENKKFPYISCYDKFGLLGFFRNKTFKQIKKHFKTLNVEYITIVETINSKYGKYIYNTEGELINSKGRIIK